MGCGKSTVGRRVAGRLGYGFVDLDRSVEEKAGMDIPGIFAAFGEEGFRRMEREALESIRPEGNVIVAAGGGAPCFGDNLEVMKSKGRVVYFRASPETLLPRLKRGQHRRPKITGMNGDELLEYIRLSVAEREEYYLQASVIIDCDGVGDEYIASHLEHYILNS